MKKELLSYGIRFTGLLLLLVLTKLAAVAQAPAWQQPTSIALGSNASGAGIVATAADGAGSVYVTGNFTGTATFGATSLTSASSSYDVFVAKYNAASRTFVWAKKISCAAGNFKPAAIAVNGASVYVAGTFYDSNPILFGNVSLTNNHPNNFEVFVTKLTDTGPDASFVWVQQLGGPQADTVTGLAVSGAGVYVAGRYDGPGPASFGSLSLSTANTSGTAYVAKLTDSGTSAPFVWARQVTAGPGGSANISVTALALSGPHLYVGGATNEYFSRLVFDGLTPPAAYTTGKLFVAKLEDAGTSAAFMWARPLDAVSGQITGVAVNGSNVYIGGPFGYSIQMGSLSLSSPANGYSFVAKLTDAGSTGSFVWAQGTGGTTYEVIRGVAVSGSRVYATGPADGSGIYYDFDLRINNTRNIFLARFSDAGQTGSLDWTARAGSSNSAGTCGVTALAFAQGTAYIAGYVSGGLTFGAYGASGPGAGSGYITPLADNTTSASLAQTDFATEVDVCPNPAHGRATVQLPAGTGPATLTVLDALGRPVRAQTTTASKAELDLTGLAPGLYAVRVQMGGATANQRLVVE